MKSTRWNKPVIWSLVVLLSIGGLAIYNGYFSKTNGGREISFDVSPKDDTIVFTGDGVQSRNLYLFDMRKRKVTQLTATPEQEREPHFSVDGAYITWLSGRFEARNSQIGVYSVRDKKTKFIIVEKAGVTAPIFSPHNSYIVFSRAQEYSPIIPPGGGIWTVWDLYRVKPDGTELTRLTNRERSALSWIGPIANSPDIICVTVVDTKSQPRFQAGIYRVPVEKRLNGFVVPKRVPIQNSPSGQGYVYPAVSPDGKKLACVSYNRRSLSIMDLNGQNAKELTSGLGETRCPRFSSNGKYLYYLTSQRRVGQNWDKDDPELWRIDVTGKNQKRIADPTLFSNPLSWKPTGNAGGIDVDATKKRPAKSDVGNSMTPTATRR